MSQSTEGMGPGFCGGFCGRGAAWGRSVGVCPSRGLLTAGRPSFQKRRHTAISRSVFIVGRLTAASKRESGQFSCLAAGRGFVAFMTGAHRSQELLQGFFLLPVFLYLLMFLTYMTPVHAGPQASRSHLFLPALLQASCDVETVFVFVHMQASGFDLSESNLAPMSWSPEFPCSPAIQVVSLILLPCSVTAMQIKLVSVAPCLQ